MDTIEFVSKLNEAISSLQMHLINESEKIVMANDIYVQVEEGKGLNGFNILVRCPQSAVKARLFDSVEEAIRNGEYYLKDGADRPILLHPMLASELYEDEIRIARETISLISRMEEQF